jgi:hypothetical protein
MSSRNLLAYILTTCLLSIGFLGMAPIADAAPSKKSYHLSEKARKNARKNRLGFYRDVRGPWRPLPIAPTYNAFDYPYEYDRGHYPTHIGPGFIYYGYRYDPRLGYYTNSSDRCSRLDRRCGDDW